MTVPGTNGTQVWLECMDYYAVPGMVVVPDSSGAIGGCFIGHRSYKCVPDAALDETCPNCKIQDTIRIGMCTILYSQK
jgi:hypothetical protein